MLQLHAPAPGCPWGTEVSKMLNPTLLPPEGPFQEGRGYLGRAPQNGEEGGQCKT